MKQALFGCGSGLELFFELASESDLENVSVIFDNSLACDRTVKGIQVADPERHREFDFDQVLITSRHYAEIHNQLMVLGIDKEKVRVFLPLINF